MRDAFALDDGPYHFFDRSSRSAAASNICSAKSFFSFAFSSSSCFNRFASDTSMPPYLAFQLYSVASETPCLRSRSAVFAPASCSFNTPMIRSSVNRARFICPSLFQGRTLNPRGGKSQWQVKNPWFRSASRRVRDRTDHVVAVFNFDVTYGDCRGRRQQPAGYTNTLQARDH